jgi:hypothetical protein
MISLTKELKHKTIQKFAFEKYFYPISLEIY